MKSRLLRGALLLVAALLLLSSCSVPALTLKDGAYLDKKTNVSYLPAPSCYQAIGYAKDSAVARIKLKEMDDLVLYPIDGMEGNKWLCNEDYQVFYADSETLPELWEMDVTKVCVNRTVNQSYTVATILKKEDIAALINAYQNGPSFEQSDMDEGLVFEKYDLVFEASALRYCLTYWKFEKEVLIYETIADPNSFTPTYPNVRVTTEEYHYTRDGQAMVEHLAVYHFGTEILYNRETGLCYPVEGTVADYLPET